MVCFTRQARNVAGRPFITEGMAMAFNQAVSGDQSALVLEAVNELLVAFGMEALPDGITLQSAADRLFTIASLVRGSSEGAATRDSGGTQSEFMNAVAESASLSMSNRSSGRPHSQGQERLFHAKRVAERHGITVTEAMKLLP